MTQTQHASARRAMKDPSVQNAGPTESRLGAPSPPSSLRRRLRVGLHRGRLDQQVAAGSGSDPIEDRALRARQLAGKRMRRRLAKSLRARVKDAERPVSPHLSAAVPLCRRSVLAACEGLLGLAERLESPDPVNPCGVARVLVLLTDGTGPLYTEGSTDRLREAVWWIADGLALDADEDPGHATA